MIIEGERNLSLKSLLKVSKGLGLNEQEENFLETMVKFNQAKDVQDEQRYYEELLKYSAFKNVRKTESEQYKHFGHWYVLAILEGLATKWGENSEEEMAKSLGIELSQVQDALKLLTRLKLVEHRNGKWQKLDAFLETPPTTGSEEMEQMYREMGAKAVEAIEKYPRSMRSHTGLTAALTYDQFLELKAKVFEMQTHLNIDFPVREEASHVFQLNIQLFPLCQIGEAQMEHDSED